MSLILHLSFFLFLKLYIGISYIVLRAIIIIIILSRSMFRTYDLTAYNVPTGWPTFKNQNIHFKIQYQIGKMYILFGHWMYFSGWSCSHWISWQWILYRKLTWLASRYKIHFKNVVQILIRRRKMIHVLRYTR